MSSTGFFRQPEGGVALDVQPRLESWDAKGSPSQVGLSLFLDHLETVVEPQVAALQGRGAVSLTVQVPAHRGVVSGGGDLDNYLFPVVRRLGWSHFMSAWALKGRQPPSVSISPAVETEPPSPDWGSCAVTTTASATTTEFKDQIASAVPVLALSPSTGPVEVQIAYRLSGRRNWAALWKPTIDAMGGVLGVPNPAKRYAPNDDRIVRLGLHRSVDDSLGWKVAIGMYWRFIDSDSPLPARLA